MKNQVLFISRYSFTDAGGRTVTGCKVTALGPVKTAPDAKGHEVITYSAPYELFDSFSQVPGNYELDFQHFQSQGKASVRLVGAKPV